jgi:phosphoribosylamine--glycine ligase
MKQLDTILIIGSGGREHALAWKLAQSPRVGSVCVAPGNAGTLNNIALSVIDVDGLFNWALTNRPALTIVGPEVTLSLGLVDRFTAAGLPVFGPTQAAARIETSKVFAKQFMRKYGIPTAPFEIFDDFRAAMEYVMLNGDRELAIKADGLASGKGVFLTDCAHDAEMAVRALMIEQQLGDAGLHIVIEKVLHGEEVSVLAFCDGEQAHLMPFAQDHKRAYNGDQGLNTGGMGAVAPVKRPPFTDVITPALRGLAAEGTPFHGVLFAGVMLTADGPYVLEYNCRWGDPETQAILPLLDNDLYAVLLGEEAPIWSETRHAATVVIASDGYPGEYPIGLPISGLDSLPADVMAFHAGTKHSGNKVVTSGGRVLAMTASGASLQDALNLAYSGVHAVYFDGAQFRSDIGAKVLAAGIVTK